jgi:hypothetical protein
MAERRVFADEPISEANLSCGGNAGKPMTGAYLSWKLSVGEERKTFGGT